MKQKSSRKKLKKRKLLLKLVIAVLSVLIMFQFTLYFFGEALFGEYIKFKIDNATKGTYVIKYEKLRINPIMFGIKFQGVNISKRNKNTEDNTSLDALSFESINITGIKLLKVINENKILISSINILNPTISLTHSKDQNSTSEEEIVKVKEIENKIQEVLLVLFSEINIDYFSIKTNNANTFLLVNGKTPNWLPIVSDKLSLVIKEFHIPPDEDSGINMFYTSDIIVKGEEISYYLKDSLFKIHASKFLTSLTSGRIVFDALNVEKRTKEGKYSPLLSMPKYKMQVENIYKILEEKSIEIKSMHATEPNFSYTLSEKTNSNKKKGEVIDFKDINTLIINNLTKYGIKRLKINAFTIANGNIVISRKKTEDYLYKIKKADINFSDINIDSSTYHLHDRVLFTKEIKIKTGNILVTDAVNNLKIDSKIFSFNSKDQRIEIDKLTVEQNQKNKNQSFFSIPKVVIKGLDLLKYYNSKDINIYTITFLRPKIKVAPYSKKTSRSTNIKKMKARLSQWVKKLKINLLTVENANVAFVYKSKISNKQIQSRVSINEASFKIKNVSLNTSKKSNSYASIINFNDFNSIVKNYQMTLSDNIHILKINHVDISTNKKYIQALDAKIIPIKTNKKTIDTIKAKKGYLFDISFPSLRLDNVDIKKMYNYRKMDIGKIQAKNPSINISIVPKTSKKSKNRGIINPYPLIKNLLEYIYVKNVNFQGGNFKIINLNDGKKIVEQKGTTITASDFRINKNTKYDKESIFYSKKISGRITKYIINLPDNVHKLEINNLVVNSNDEIIKAQSARLYPASQRLDTVRTVKTFYNIYAPNIKFSGVNIKNIYNNHKFKASSVSLQSPDIDVIKNTNQRIKQVKRKWQDYQKSMPKRIDDVEIGRFNISEGNLKASTLKGQVKTPFLGTKVRLNLKNVRINNEILKKIDKIFYAEEFYLQMNDFSLDFNNRKKVLTANQINIELKKKGGSFFATDFHLFTNYKSQKDHLGSYSIFMPVLTLEEFDFNKAMLKNQYDMKTMTVVDPEIKIIQVKSKKASMHINHHLKNIVPKEIKLSIGKANINNAHVNIKQDKNKKVYKGINLKLENFKMSKENKSTRKILFSDDVTLLIPNLYFKTSDSLYVIKTNKIKISTSQKHLKIDSLRVIPRYTHNIFTKKVKYQTDRMNFNISTLECMGIDYSKYLDDKEVHVRSMDINRFKLEIDRDKNFKEKKNKHKPNSIHGLLKEIKLPIIIGKLKAKNGQIIYREIPKKGKFPLDAAKITLSEVNFEGSNMQNIPSRAKKINLTMSALLLKRIGLKVTVVNQMNSDKMRVFGNLQSTNLSVFNPILRKLANISVSNGYAQNLSYDFNTVGDKANGTMFFTYDNLKISVNKDNGRRQGLTSFLANTFFINTSNKQGNQYRKGIIAYKKIAHRGPVNFIIKSIFTGIQNSIGIDNNKKPKKNKGK